MCVCAHARLSLSEAVRSLSLCARAHVCVCVWGGGGHRVGGGGGGRFKRMQCQTGGRREDHLSALCPLLETLLNGMFYLPGLQCDTTTSEVRLYNHELLSLFCIRAGQVCLALTPALSLSLSFSLSLSLSLSSLSLPSSSPNFSKMSSSLT